MNWVPCELGALPVHPTGVAHTPTTMAYTAKGSKSIYI